MYTRAHNITWPNDELEANADDPARALNTPNQRNVLTDDDLLDPENKLALIIIIERS